MVRMLVVMALMSALNGITNAQSAQDSVPGVVLVKFERGKLANLRAHLDESDILIPEVRNILAQYGLNGNRQVFRHSSSADTDAVSRSGEHVKLTDVSHWYAFRIADSSNLPQLLNRLKGMQGVLAACPAHKIRALDIHPNDPHFQDRHQWGLYNEGSPGNDIHASQAWEFNKGRSDVTVAIVDGGVDYSHPDLDTGDRSRVIQGYDTGDDDNDPMDDIVNSGGNTYGGHGTMVAGVIGAITSNYLGVAGIMWNCKLLPIKAASTGGLQVGPFNFGAGTATDMDLAEGIEYARTHGAQVINMSFGGTGDDFWTRLEVWWGGDPLAEATWNAYQSGVVLAAAMGNEDASTVYYPAGYPWVIGVGATNIDDDRVTKANTAGYWGSNYGAHTDLVAPGAYEYTTTRGGTYDDMSGTSCATPFVSGVAGLVISQGLDRGLTLTNDDVRHLLEATADKVPGMGGQNWTQEYGFGRLNAATPLSHLNLPYEFSQATASVGSATLVWDSHSQQFFSNGGLASGAYFGVKQYRVSWHVNFGQAYAETPYVWVRERQTNGWSADSPNLELPRANISNVTNSGFDISTYVYWIGSNSIGQTIEKYYPGATDAIQASVAYTIVGRHTIEAPTSLSPRVLSPNQIRLTWQDNSSNEKSFSVERSTNGVNFASIGEVSTNGNGSGTRTYDDASLTQNVTYYYRIRAKAQTFTSNYSAVVNRTIPTLSAVSNLTAQSQPMYVELNWDPIPNVDGYRILRDGAVVGLATTSQFRDHVPDYSQSHYYEVRPYAGDYEGPAYSVNGQAIHFASSSLGALASSAQHKFIKLGNTYHLVYTSGANIYYTYSTDAGATWSPEEQVSENAEGTQRLNPAIDVYHDNAGTVIPWIAYEVVVDAAHRDLVVKKKSGSSWDTYPASSPEFLASTDMKPVIATTTKVIVVLQATGVSTSDPGLYCVDVSDGGVVKVSGTSSSSVNPTLVWYNLAYQDGDGIYHKRLDYSGTTIGFSDRTMVSTTLYNGHTLSNIANPSIAVRQETDGDLRPVIAWQASDQNDLVFTPLLRQFPV